MGFLILIAGALAAAAYLYTHSFPAGSGPFEQLPKGLPQVTGSDKLKATSGRSYHVTSYAPNAQDQTFHVAVQDGHANWISYSNQRATGKRALYKAYASGNTTAARDAQLALMRKDFGV